MPSIPQQKVAIVTGANRGIGRAIGIALAATGVRVLLTARDALLLHAVEVEIRDAGNAAATVACDLRNPESPATVVQTALNAFGRIDMVVNNAGATKRGKFLDLTDGDWADGFGLKFFGAVRLIRFAWPHLKATGGSIINIAGIGGRTPGAEFAIGGSVNAAMLSLTKALADQGIADGVQVNAINPGRVKTDRLTKRLRSLVEEKGCNPEEAEQAMIREAGITRFAEPHEVADFVTYIVSEKGRFFQGSLIDMDGGETKTL